MLVIENIDEFREKVAHKEEIRELDIGHGCTSFCYMISTASTFDDAWSRECRGIVFSNKTGKVISRPLHKFFNVGERESTRVENLDWSIVTRVMNKSDGSFLHPVPVKGGFLLKSKKTFTSDVAIAGQKFIDRPENKNYHDLINKLIERGKTPIFEYMSPVARIVVYYPEETLELLHIRDNLTGRYASLQELTELTTKHNVPLVADISKAYRNDDSTLNVSKLLEDMEKAEGIEGCVIQFAKDMVKLKTKWYLKLHRTIVFVRERDIAQTILDEELDDIKSMITSEGIDMGEILEIEERVLSILREMSHAVTSIFAEDKHLTQKEFAIKHRQHPYFGLLMSQYQGKEPKFKEFFERNILKEQFSLRQLNLIPSVAEVD